MDRIKGVLEFLPWRIRGELERFDEDQWEQLQELRFRLGQPLTALCRGEERVVSDYVLAAQDLSQTLELAARGSFHTVLPQLRQGFLTLPGGHRLGVCGTVRMREGSIHAIDPISSLNLRLARSVPEAGQEIVPRICPEGVFRSTLILAPPGAGKTTLLRNIIKGLSDGELCHFRRIGLVDERGEVAALWNGVPQLAIGTRTDVLEGCPKAQGLLLLLRGMNPQVLAVDEITAPEDVAAMQTAFGCGVELLATAHGREREDLERRRLYRELVAAEIFQFLVTIRLEGGQRRYEVEALR